MSETTAQETAMVQRDRGDEAADMAARRRWFVLTIAAVIGILPLFPPRAGDPGSELDFSTTRALDHIDWIAAAPHPIGSEENVRVRERIVDELAVLGVVAERQRITAPDWFDPTGAPVDVVNVVARIPGHRSTGAVAVVGHFDTVPTTPGANDNSSAVAVMLEAARVIAAGEPLRNDIVFVFTDGEEPAPRFGATAFVEEHRWSDDVEFVINLEAIGSGGPSLLVEVGGPTGWVTGHYLDAVPHPAVYSFLTELTRLIGGSNTDFARFRDAGTPGVEMVYLRGSPIYHTMDDAPDRVGARSLYQHGANTTALLRHLGDADITAVSDDAAPVLFTVGRERVVRYPGWFTLAGLVAGAVAMGAAHRTLAAAKRSARDAAGSLACALGLAVGGSLVWVLLAAWRPSMGVAEGYLYLVVLAALTAGGSLVLHRVRPSTPTPSGTVALWWLLAAVALAVGPGTSSLFVWTALFAAASLACRRALRTTAAELCELASLVAAAVLMIPAIDVFFQFAQPRPGNPESQITWTIGVPLLLIALVTALVLSFDTASVGGSPGEPTGAMPDPDDRLTDRFAEPGREHALHVGAHR